MGLLLFFLGGVDGGEVERGGERGNGFSWIGLDAHVSRCIYGAGGAVREVSIEMMKIWGDNLCQTKDKWRKVPHATFIKLDKA